MTRDRDDPIDDQRTRVGESTDDVATFDATLQENRLEAAVRGQPFAVDDRLVRAGA